MIHIEKSCLFVQPFMDDFRPIGAGNGFLFYTQDNRLFFGSAKHVFYNEFYKKPFNGLVLYHYDEKGKRRVVGSAEYLYGFDGWHQHTNKDVDIAIMPVRNLPQGTSLYPLPIPDENLMLKEGSKLVTVGFTERNFFEFGKPHVIIGDKLAEDGRWYISDVSSLWGQSGCPVFFKTNGSYNFVGIHNGMTKDNAKLKNIKIPHRAVATKAYLINDILKELL